MVLGMTPEELQRLVGIDRRHVWRPYTSSDDHERMPLLAVERAQGPWLVTPGGEKVLDGSGSWWCNNLGHGHPRLRQALVRQAGQLMHCSFAGTVHESAVALAEELVAVAPAGLNRVFYSDNGSTAVEVALKIAFQYWQQNGRASRRKFVALPGAYHGDTIGAMSVGAVDEFTSQFAPLMFDVLRPEAGAWDVVFDALTRLVNDRADEIAGVIVEPIVQGAAGMRMYTPAHLSALREATKRADTFLIADEVFTGFGRTGEMWACEHANVAPDLLCTAKGLSGGVMPFAATLATERIFDGFRGDKTRALMHGHTFCGNPLGAAVAREVLAIYRDEKIIERARPKARMLAEAISSIGEISGVRDTRSRGMVAAVDVGTTGYFGETGWRVHEAALERGAQLRPLGNTVYVVPPLNIDDDDLKSLVQITHDSIREVLETSA